MNCENQAIMKMHISKQHIGQLWFKTYCGLTLPLKELDKLADQYDEGKAELCKTCDTLEAA